jgi:hypothetical protein
LCERITEAEDPPLPTLVIDQTGQAVLEENEPDAVAPPPRMIHIPRNTLEMMLPGGREAKAATTTSPISTLEARIAAAGQDLPLSET